MVDGTFGIDTMAVTVPAHWQWDQFPLQTGGYVRVRHNWAHIEACLPKRRYGNNLMVVTLADALVEMQQAIDETATQIKLVCTDVCEALLKRIDITRVFLGVDDPMTALYAAQARPRRKDWRSTLETNHLGVPTYVHLGPRKSWFVRVYDKSAQTGDNPDAKGMVRVEAMLPDHTLAESAWARNLDATVRYVGDLTSDKVMVLGEASFHRVDLSRMVQLPWDPSVYVNFDWTTGTIGIGAIDEVVQIYRESGADEVTY